jgi:hypothetical protein
MRAAVARRYDPCVTHAVWLPPAPSAGSPGVPVECPRRGSRRACSHHSPGAVSRVGRRAARPLPARRPAKVLASGLIWSKVAGARKRGNGVFKIIYKDKQGDANAGGRALPHTGDGNSSCREIDHLVLGARGSW